MRSMIFLLLFSFPLLAHEDFMNLQAKKKINDIFEQENFFQLATAIKLSSRMGPKVNPIEGDLNEEEMDYVVAGIEPLSVKRFYTHSAPYEERTGGWRYNPESFLAANFGLGSSKGFFAAVGAANGEVTTLKPAESPEIYKMEFAQEFFNFTPNGQTHPCDLL